jgi:hypothetical protein
MVACDNEDVSIGLQTGTASWTVTQEAGLSKMIKYIF